ncbi:hypothetical protein Tco_1229005 [Tanacetum coccineum]
MLIRYLNAIEKEVDARAHHEEELRITERDIKEKQETFEMQKQETMIQKGIDSENTCSLGGFQRAFSSFFGEAVEHFSPRMFFNLDKLEKHLNNTEFDEEVSMIVFKTQEGMVNMVKYNCDVVIRLSNDTKPVNKVQSTAAYNMFANDRQHAEQPKFINEGKVDQDAEQRLDKPPFLASIIENKITESINQTFESKNDRLKKTIAQFQKDFSKLEAQNDSSLSLIVESHISELEKESEDNIYENAKCDLQTKIVKLGKVLTQQTKDFDDVKLELSNRTVKFEAYFKKLKNMKVVPERQLAQKIDDSKAEKDQFLKEINHLRTQLENLKGKSIETKFDKHSILRKPPTDKLLINSQISKSSFTPKVVVEKDLSKPVTAQSLPKNEKDQLLK